MNLPEFLVEAPYGEIRLAGSRIGLYHLVESYNEGFSAEMLVEEYPTLPLAQIHKVIAFYLKNKNEVDDYVEKERQALEELRRTGRQPVWIALSARFEELKRSGLLPKAQGA